MHVLVATDATWILDDVVASLGGPDTSFTVCRDGRAVATVVAERTPDVAVLDLQIGSMGGMAVVMDLRHDESSGRLPHIPVLMLLDRAPDVHLARRSGAEGWMIKPLDPLRLRRAVAAVTAGEPYREGEPLPPSDHAPDMTDSAEDADAAASAEPVSDGEPAATG